MVEVMGTKLDSKMAFLREYLMVLQSGRKMDSSWEPVTGSQTALSTEFLKE